MTNRVRLDIADHVGIITLDNPRLNILTSDVQDDLRRIAEEIAARRDIRSVVVTGTQTTFSVGADVKEMRGKDFSSVIDDSRAGPTAWASVARIPQPTVAAISGFALGGGCELAMCCDFRIASDSAQLGQPEILLGLIPGAGGTQRLARLVGVSVAKELIFTGRIISASEALDIGLVSKVVPDGEALSSAMTFAAELARGPLYALRAAKEAIDRGVEVDLETALEIERIQAGALMSTPDPVIGIESFLRDGAGKAKFHAD